MLVYQLTCAHTQALIVVLTVLVPSSREAKNMATLRDRNKDCCNHLRNRVYLFVYEAEGNCGNVPWNHGEKPSEGFYILLGSFVLMVSLCVLYYDLILQEPTEGSATSNANPSIRRHYNTPVATPPSPLLSRREYWI